MSYLVLSVVGALVLFGIAALIGVYVIAPQLANLTAQQLKFTAVRWVILVVLTTLFSYVGHWYLTGQSKIGVLDLMPVPCAFVVAFASAFLRTRMRRPRINQ